MVLLIYHFNNINTWNVLILLSIMENNSVTIVSAFIGRANMRPDRSVDNYIEYGKKLMSAPVNKIIFFDESFIEKCPREYFNDNTIIIPVKKEDNYLYNYKDKITEFHVNTDFAEKDTLDYMLTICHKTEYVKKAIELDPFKSKQFVWIDFGINHMLKKNSSTEDFLKVITSVKNKIYDNVRIASIWEPPMYEMAKNTFNRDIYKDVMWFFAGSVFGGDSQSLIKFAELTKEKCLKLIEERRSLMWEVNVWFLVYMENPTLFSLYSSDHNDSVVENY